MRCSPWGGKELDMTERLNNNIDQKLTQHCKALVFQLQKVAQRLKRLPPMWENQVQSLGREDPLEEEMATHSSILAWRIPWTEEPGGLQSTGSQRVGHD